MKIDILLHANPVKKRPYKLTGKYKDMVKNKIDNMIKAGIIYRVDQSEWPILMVA